MTNGEVWTWALEKAQVCLAKDLPSGEAGLGLHPDDEGYLVMSLGSKPDGLGGGHFKTLAFSALGGAAIASDDLEWPVISLGRPTIVGVGAIQQRGTTKDDQASLCVLSGRPPQLQFMLSRNGRPGGQIVGLNIGTFELERAIDAKFEFAGWAMTFPNVSGPERALPLKCVTGIIETSLLPPNVK